MTVPQDGPFKKESKPSKQKDPIDWGFVIYDLSPGICGIVLIICLSILVFWQNWNWWLIPIGILAVVALICAWELSEDDELGVAGFVINLIVLIMMFGYGVAQVSWSDHQVDQKTALFCGLDSKKDDDGNTYLVFRGPNGDFVINDGTYTVKDPSTGKLQKEFFSTGKAASATFVTGHAYSVTVDNFEGQDSLDGIVAAHEVPTNETCSNR